jgi:hypothetical protein
MNFWRKETEGKIMENVHYTYMQLKFVISDVGHKHINYIISTIVPTHKLPSLKRNLWESENVQIS